MPHAKRATNETHYFHADLIGSTWFTSDDPNQGDATLSRMAVRTAFGEVVGLAAAGRGRVFAGGDGEGPMEHPWDWTRRVSRPDTDTELAALRKSVIRGAPFGGDRWEESAAKQHGRQSALRPRGRSKLKK